MKRCDFLLLFYINFPTSPIVAIDGKSLGNFWKKSEKFLSKSPLQPYDGKWSKKNHKEVRILHHLKDRPFLAKVSRTSFDRRLEFQKKSKSNDVNSMIWPWVNFSEKVIHKLCHKIVAMGDSYFNNESHGPILGWKTILIEILSLGRLWILMA